MTEKESDDEDKYLFDIIFFAFKRELITTLVQFSEMLDVINQLTNYNTNADNYDDY